MSSLANAATRTAIAILFCSGVLFKAEAQVYRVGGDVAQPRLIEKVDHSYTPEARSAKIEGSVVLRFEVNEQGKVENIRMLKSLDAGLDAKAIEAVRQWRFDPGKKGDKPVRVDVALELNFRLR